MIVYTANVWLCYRSACDYATYCTAWVKAQ